MTPNKPVIAEEARKLLTGANSKLENDMLDMVSRLADVITYNAEAMNKLVARVEQLEKAEMSTKAETTLQVGNYLETVLKEDGVDMVLCKKAESNAYKEGKMYPVRVREEDAKYVVNENGAECGISSSLFVAMRKCVKLQELLSNPSVQLVKCAKTNSKLWEEGKVYTVLVNADTRGDRKVKDEYNCLRSTSCSLFVEVKPEPSKVVHFANQLSKEQRLHMFLEQTRMFVGLPTIHLIKPHSL